MPQDNTDPRDAQDPALLDAAVCIVTAYVSNNVIQPADLPRVLTDVYAALEGILNPAPAEAEPLVPPVAIRKTITPDHIISLEDGKPYKTLRRHLTGRGMTPDQYRAKWGLPPDYPMVAPNYAVQRSQLAKAAGLGQQRSRAA